MNPAEPVGRPAIGENEHACRSGHRFIVFLLTGIVSTLVDVGLLWLFTECMGSFYLLSATASYCCGIFVSYGMNKFLTFHDRNRDYLKQFSLFAIVSASSLAINLIILFVAVDILAIHYMLGKGFAVGVSFFWNYLGQCRITFHVDDRVQE